MKTLFDGLKIGNLELENRIIYSPLTRSRADDEGVQPEYAAEYLRAESVCRFADHGSDDIGDGERLRPHAGNLYGRADRIVAKSNRCGSRERRKNLYADLSHGQNRPAGFSARKSKTGRAFSR